MAWPDPCGRNMEEFDSKDFSTSKGGLCAFGKRKQGGVSSEGEEEEGASRESGGSSSEEEDRVTEEEEGTGSEDVRKRKEDGLWMNFLNDVGPKSQVPPRPHIRKRGD